MSAVLRCDECGKDISELRYWTVERHGDITLVTDDEPGGWDFCSEECLGQWVAHSTFSGIEAS